jgi:hypothetical protein
MDDRLNDLDSENADLNSSQINQNYNRKRSSVYKIKKEFIDYSQLCFDHKIYSYYLEFTYETIKKIFQITFYINRMQRCLLCCCVLFQTIWWLPNSISNNYAINFSHVNVHVISFIMYVNFNEILIRQLMMRYLLINLKNVHLFSVQRIKSALNILEILIYSLLNIFIFYYLRWMKGMSIKLISCLLIPHIILLLYHQFDINIKIGNFTIISNLYQTPNNNSNNNNNEQNDRTDTNTTVVYKDFSNKSISDYLNQNFNDEIKPSRSKTRFNII